MPETADHDTALPRRRSIGRSDNSWVLDRFCPHTAAVVEVEQTRPRLRRIRLAGPDVAGWQWQPGQQIRVAVQALPFFQAMSRGELRDQVRTYSVGAFDSAAGTADLYVFRHRDDTPGPRWADQLTVGDTVAFRGPEGKLVLRSEAAYHVFVGEETAQVAFAPMIAALADTAVFGVLEVAEAHDRLDFEGGDKLEWRYRGGRSATASPTLLEAVRRLDLPREPGVVYIAGEAQACASVRRHFRQDREWARRGSVVTKPFWTPGKRGLD